VQLQTLWYSNIPLTSRQIILTVRKSVRSIIDLDPKHQSQVIEAYDRSLKITFISAIVVFVIANILILAMKLPTLKKKDADEETEEPSTP
jgi:fucose permease